MTGTSVIIPCYNRPELLRECLDSFLAVSGDYEIIVVDDGSEDDLAGVASRVRYHRIAHGGTSAARNAGIDIAEGESIMFFDSDDIALPGLVEERQRALSRTGLDGVYGDYFKSGGRHGQDWHQARMRQYPNNAAAYRSLCMNQTIPFPSTLWRRDVLERVRFDEELLAAEDWEFILQVIEAGFRVAYDGLGIALWVWRQGNWPRHTGSPDQLEGLEKIRARRAGR